MRNQKLMASIICLIGSLCGYSQVSVNDREIYYEYELKQIGVDEKGIDTTYALTIILDTIDAKFFTSITVESEISSDEFSFNNFDKEAITKDLGGKYFIDMKEWLGGVKWKIFAELADGREVMLTRKPVIGDIVPEVVSCRMKTRDLKFSEKQPVCEEEITEKN